MTGVSLQYTFDDRDVVAMLSRLDHYQKGDLLDEIGGYLDRETTRRFNDQVDWEGNALESSQRALNEGGKTLIDHAILIDSYTYNVFLNAAGLEFGSALDYAAIHQFGGKAGRNHSVTLPARPILGINADDEAEIQNIVDDFMRDVLK